MKFFVLVILGVLPYAYGQEVSENEGKIYSCQIKKEQCQFSTVGPKFYASCENDDTICSGGGGEIIKCEGDSRDPEDMKFCTAKMPDINDLREKQKPWVLCSDECFDGSEPKEYDDKHGCSAEVRQCKFPFKFNGKEYKECTNDLLHESEDNSKTVESFKWCATSTNTDGRMKKGKWGRCDVSTCKWESPAGSGGLSGGAIAGIIIAIIAALATVAGLVYSKKENKFCFAGGVSGAIPVPLN